MIMPPPVPGKGKRIAVHLFILASVTAVLGWSWVGTEMNLSELAGSGSNLRLFLSRMLPPDLTWNPTEARPFVPPLRLAAATVAVTLQISLLGTFLGTLAAFGLGFLAAENLTPIWIHHPVKTMLALLRSIPVLVLALLFVAAVGLGPFPGVLAIAIHSIGMLGKLFAEQCESAEWGVWEALDSVGANWLQKVRFAIWPQVSRQFASLILFRIDMNIRESAVLGFVGVGGLGLWIENYRRAFDYRSVATMVLVTMLVVLAVEQASIQIRRRLR